MIRTNIVKSFAILCILCASFMAANCATGGDSMKSPEQQEASLRLAAEQYWNARIDGKYETAYAFEDKERLPADFTEYKLKASSILKVNPQSVKIGAIAIDGERATVTVKFTIRVPDLPKTAVKSIKDEWKYQKGKWLHRLPD